MFKRTGADAIKTLRTTFSAFTILGVSCSPMLMAAEPETPAASTVAPDAVEPAPAEFPIVEPSVVEPSTTDVPEPTPSQIDRPDIAETASDNFVTDDSLDAASPGLYSRYFAPDRLPPRRGKHQLLFPGWTYTPEVELRGTYTDNLFFENNNTSDDFVNEINPGIQVFGDQPRLKFGLRYTLQNLFYTDHDDLNDNLHRLFSSATAELVKRFLFFDANATISQQNFDSFNRQSRTSNFGPSAFLGGVGDNISGATNRLSLFTYSVGPRFTHQFGNLAIVNASFLYNTSQPLDDIDQASTVGTGFQTDTVGFRYLADISSGPRFTRLLWNLRYERNDFEFGGTDSRDTKFENGMLNLAYVINPKYHILGSAGYEDNTFATTIGPTSGPIWDIGFRWAPTTRTNATATYGQRFFGDRFFIDVSHRAQRLTFRVSYTEQIQVARQTQIASAELSQGGAIAIIDPVTGLVLPTGGVPRLIDEAFVQRLISSSIFYHGVRDDFNLQFFQTQREYQFTRSNDEEILGVTGIWTRRLTPSTNVQGAVTWTRNERGTGPGAVSSFGFANFDLIQLNLQLDHKITPNLTGLLGYRHVQSSSEIADSEFDENRLFGGLRLLF